MAKILVIDDDRAITRILQVVLGSGGHEVFVAPDGAHGLIAAHEVHPDLILLDEMMPLLDGSSTLRALKASPETQPIPVVMVTVQNGNGYTRALYDLGVELHVVKPFDPEEILEICNRLVPTECSP